MDYKKAGIKALKVAGYIAVSMAVVALGLYINNPHISIQEIKIPTLVAGANVLLVFLKELLPSDIKS